MAQGQEANGDNLGNRNDLMHGYGMLSVFIRVTSMRRFC